MNTRRKDTLYFWKLAHDNRPSKSMNYIHGLSMTSRMARKQFVSSDTSFGKTMSFHLTFLGGDSMSLTLFLLLYK